MSVREATPNVAETRRMIKKGIVIAGRLVNVVVG